MTKNKIISIDAVKIIAMFGVICLHTLNRYNPFTNITIGNIFYMLSLSALPLFFMSSGYILLGRDNINTKYCLFKILKILRFTTICCCIYFIYGHFRHGDNINSLVYNTFACFTQNGTFWWFWYFGSMILIYMCLPLINKIYRHKTFATIVLFLAIIQCVIFISDIFLLTENSIPQYLRLYNWLSYFMIGGLIKTHITSFSPKRSMLLAIISMVACVIFIYFLTDKFNLPYNFYYCSLPIIILTSSIFIFCNSIKFKQITASVIMRLSTVFLPVYTLHIFVKASLLPIIPPNSIISTIIIATVTITISLIIMRIPYLRGIFKI